MDYIVSVLSDTLTKQLKKGDVDYTVVRTLSKVLSQFGSKVTSSEKTAHLVVSPIVLPIAESNPTSGSSSQTSQIKCAALDCVAGLLRHGTHASALLSPLVVDVEDDGTEITIPNPLRKRIFNLLEKSLGEASKNFNAKEIASSARALTHATEAVGSMNRSNSSGGGARGGNGTLAALNFAGTSSVANGIVGNERANGEGNVAFHTLHLLLSMASRFGRQMVVQWDMFLTADSNNPTPLVRLVTGGTNEKDRVIGIRTLTEIVKGMPLGLWMGGGRGTTGQGEWVMPKNIQNLSTRVKRSIANLLNLSSSTLSDPLSPDDVVSATCDLVSTVVSSVPSKNQREL